MSQQTFTASPPAVSQFPITFNLAGQWRPGIRTIEVDNATALTLTVVADGAVIRTVPPYVPRFNVNTGGGWQTIQVKSNGAAIQTTDTLTIIVYDQLVVPPLLPSFGPAAWGGGAIPNSLVTVAPGDSFAAWQVQQIIDLLTGVMTGQPVTLADGLTADGIVSTANNVLDDGVGDVSIIGQQIINTINFPGLKIERGNSTNQAIEIVGSGGGTTHGDFEVGATNDTHPWGTGFFVFDVRTGNRVFLVDASDNLNVDHRLSASATGASGAPLLNFVPIRTVTSSVFSGNGSKALTNFTQTTVPTSAVAVSVAIHFVSGTVNDQGIVADPAGTGQLSVRTPATSAGGVASDIGGVIGCSNGTMQYGVSQLGGNTNWLISIEALGYFELS